MSTDTIYDTFPPPLHLPNSLCHRRVLLRKPPWLTLTCSKAQRQQPERGGLDRGSESHPPCSAAALLSSHTTATRWEGTESSSEKQCNPQKGKGELFSTVTASTGGAFSHMCQQLHNCLKRLLPGLSGLLFCKSICTSGIGFLIEKASVAALYIHCSVCTPERGPTQLLRESW